MTRKLSGCAIFGSAVDRRAVVSLFYYGSRFLHKNEPDGGEMPQGSSPLNVLHLHLVMALNLFYETKGF